MFTAVAPALSKAACRQPTRRLLHSTSRRREITKFQMPAMSPTMTEGGIAEWKKKEGEAFAAGDVLLEIETDKATIDVEAQEDGIMGKIVAQNGTKNVPVGKIIALLAQEGDDISSLEVPPEEPMSSRSSTTLSSTSSSAPPSSSTDPLPSPLVPSESSSKSPDIQDRPVFPSVLRLLEENNVSDPRRIKGTGVRGMLTKGDVLAYLGKASGPNGSYKDNTPTPSIYKSQAVIKGVTSPPNKVLDAPAIRHTLLTAFLERSAKARTPPSLVPPTIDSIIGAYLPPAPARNESAPPASPSRNPPSSGYLGGLY